MPELPNGSDEHKLASMADNTMFILAGGKERTEREFEVLCKASGFSSYRIAARYVSTSSMGVIEFLK